MAREMQGSRVAILDYAIRSKEDAGSGPKR